MTYHYGISIQLESLGNVAKPISGKDVKIGYQVCQTIHKDGMTIINQHHAGIDNVKFPSHFFFLFGNYDYPGVEIYSNNICAYYQHTH